MSLPVEFDLARNIAALGGQNMVFHCHHYNCALQKAIEDGLGDAAPGVLASAAHQTVRAQLEALVPAEGRTPEGVASQACALYAELGFGQLDLSGMGPEGGAVSVENAHYSLGWLAKYGPRETPVDHFTRGFLAATFAVAHGRDVDDVQVTQTECMAVGDGHNVFTLEVK